MKKNRLIPLVLVGVLAIAGVAGCTATATSTPATSSTAPSSAVLPINGNPIVNDSTVPGLSVSYAAVEDNVDPATGAALSDQLELTIRNDSTQPATGLEVFYTMTDVTTRQQESYYQNLGSLSVAAGAETTIYFDNGSEPGHYPENTFSIYRSSSNQVDFTIEVSAQNLATANATATKGVGSGEVAD